MILKIEQSKYYGYENKTKELFKKKYRSLKLKWMESVKLNNDIVDGWISEDRTEYLLKLPEEGQFKRFTGNSKGMIEFLKNHGAVEIEGNEKGVHINYDDQKGFITQKDRYGSFIGGDLLSHRRVDEILKVMPENWGVIWSENKEIESKVDENVKVLEITKPKRRIIRRKIKNERIV